MCQAYQVLLEGRWIVAWPAGDSISGMCCVSVVGLDVYIGDTVQSIFQMNKGSGAYS